MKGMSTFRQDYSDKLIRGGRDIIGGVGVGDLPGRNSTAAGRKEHGRQD